MKRIFLAGVALALAPLTFAAGAWAEAPTTICVPEGASKPVLSAAKGECPTKYKTAALPGPAELEKLAKLLPHVNFVESGVGGKTTIQFSGINVQVVNGAGKTASRNGKGNLVIGYDENPGIRRAGGEPGVQTGSHNLILGEEQEFTGYAGTLAGIVNSIRAPFASVSGGERNTASGESASVSGGVDNVASGRGSSVSGGTFNTAQGEEASVSGGEGNEARYRSSVSGGSRNRATTTSWIGGGYRNVASGGLASIFGGKELTAVEQFEAIP
jgi:hypothetical protein